MNDRVLVLATGGTIASTAGDGAGARPTERGDELVAAVPALDGRVVVEDVARCPSVDMTFETLAGVRRRVRDWGSGSGVVVLHGTDTVEESAYYLDLTVDDGPPVVFTGAQRRPDQPGADGPANIRDAVAAAATPDVVAGGGSYVLLNGELHAAADVVKAHTWRPDAFASPDAGPVASFGPAGVERHRAFGSRTPTVPLAEPPTGTVAVVSTGIGVTDRQLRRAVDAGVDGVVLECTGLGNAPEPVADAVADAVDAGVPVVVASRCHAGSVAPVYGGGGGQVLADHGALFAGALSASKARIKLLVGLAAGMALDELFASPGA
ncbi:asparaginase [Salinigranum marinum]|uniref:asparaginase n=1 Tax=Salinigranum marinum TaxID=1515595 RepID=UPI002989C4E2|nr:asparaginase [Salinigranum marinum]